MSLHDHAHVEPGYEEHTHHGNYVRIWAILVVLLMVSVAGPFFGHPVVTLVTAFGIAFVKAYLVAKNFMHVNVAPRYVAYLVGTMLMFMLLFFAGAAPDVMKSAGSNWVKPAWVAAHEEAVAHPAAAAHGAGAHHE
ncbi:MAG: cytochrome C oxidase subunit IV family protein [Proteobacteria bacterium]|nr:cytochrome C oxidase subunit IV family protein [Pseudomonadota bacterium]